MPTKITAQQLFNHLSAANLSSYIGNIAFNLAGVCVQIDKTDIVGVTLQSWLKQYMINNNLYFSEPENTQEFPDFFLDDLQPYQNMLEVKAFNYNAQPAFDIANFESYCDSVKSKPFRLDADYLIFGYTMSENGDIRLQRMWLHKIWEISGTSTKYPLKTQVKRNVIYNIRPNSSFKSNGRSPFSSKEDFLSAIYGTLKLYRGENDANNWLQTLARNYEDYYGYPLQFR